LVRGGEKVKKMEANEKKYKKRDTSPIIEAVRRRYVSTDSGNCGDNDERRVGALGKKLIFDTEQKGVKLPDRLNSKRSGCGTGGICAMGWAVFIVAITAWNGGWRKTDVQMASWLYDGSAVDGVRSGPPGHEQEVEHTVQIRKVGKVAICSPTGRPGCGGVAGAQRSDPKRRTKATRWLGMRGQMGAVAERCTRKGCQPEE
jgi:hypothetical protein